VGNILVILLIVAVIKFVIIGVIIYVVFRPDIRSYLGRKPVATTTPVCMYCGSVYTHVAGEGETRWEQDDLVLVTEYECDHCRLPFWHVERVPVVSLKR
jgi:hypothetical protein